MGLKRAVLGLGRFVLPRPRKERGGCWCIWPLELKGREGPVLLPKGITHIPQNKGGEGTRREKFPG